VSVDQHRYSRSAELSHKTSTHVPRGAKIRPLRDHIIVEPTDGSLSAIIEVVHECKPLRGIVRAVGPGHYPKKYDHREKNKRTKMWDSKHFQPTEVKVGDQVELGGLDIGGYSFQTLYWGTKLMLVCREADVAAVRQ
jgi:co-chaperonin GroES (HSP10)